MKKSKHGSFSLGQKVESKQRNIKGKVTKIFDNALLEIDGHLCFIDSCKAVDD